MLGRAITIVATLAFLVTTSFAQLADAKLTTYRSGKEDAKGVLVVSDPGSEFEFKGSEDNIFFKLTLAAPAKDRVTYKVLIVDKDDKFAHEYRQSMPAGDKERTYQLLLPAGTYTAKLVDPNDDEKVFSTIPITVIDKFGDRATGNQKAGQAKMWICDNTDDDWNPIGPAKYNEKEKVYEWTAGKNFDVMIKNNGKPFGTLFLGIIVHTQGEDGKDTGFIDEWMSDQLDEKKATMWATVGHLPDGKWIKPGRYTIYVIDWYKRQTNEHPGNFKEYFSKVTLVVK